MPGRIHVGDQILEAAAEGGHLGANAAAGPLLHQRGFVAVGLLGLERGVAFSVGALHVVFVQARLGNAAARAEPEEGGRQGPALAQQFEADAAARDELAAESAGMFERAPPLTYTREPKLYCSLIKKP